MNEEREQIRECHLCKYAKKQWIVDHFAGTLFTNIVVSMCGTALVLWLCGVI